MPYWFVAITIFATGMIFGFMIAALMAAAGINAEWDEQREENQLL